MSARGAQPAFAACGALPARAGLAHALVCADPRRARRPPSRRPRVRRAAAAAHGAVPSRTGGAPAPAKRSSALGFLKVGITFALSGLMFVPMVLAHPLVLAFDRHRRSFHVFVALLWMRCSMICMRMRPRVVDRENLLSGKKPVVYVANHASQLDIFAVAFLGRALKYVSKSEIFKVPIIGWAMYMIGNIGVKRMNRRGQMEAYRRMIDALNRGVSLVVYPEGTRSETGKMRKFQAGAFRAAKAAGVPVVPVTILGTHEVMPANAVVPVRPAQRPIQVFVHPSIDSSTHTVDELRDLSFAAIDSKLLPGMQKA